MTCEHLARLVTTQGVVRVSLAAENVFAAANRPCLGAAVSLVPRCVEPDCVNPASRNVHVCVECVYSACDSESALDVTPAESSAASVSDDEEPVPLDDKGAYSKDALAENVRNDCNPPTGREDGLAAAGHLLSSIGVSGGGQHMTHSGPPRIRSHLTKHDMDASHPISLSVDHGRLFCSRCNDFVYNPFLDAAVELQRRIAQSHRRNFLSSQSPLDPQPYPLSEHALVRARSKRRRLMSVEHWAPTERELEIIDANSLGRAQNLSSSTAPVGLYNLGNSCYMNSVLQAFLNAPPLRSFFLADGHRPLCTRKPKSDCLACAIDKMVCDSYIGELSSCGDRGATEPQKDGSTGNAPQYPFLVPQRVLEIMWKYADNLASYMQHDAHEFLIASLNVLNAHCRRSSQKKSAATSSSARHSGTRHHDNVRSPSSREVVDKPSLGKPFQSDFASGATSARSRSRAGRTHVGGPPSPVANLRGIAACGLGETKPAPSVTEQSIVQNLFSGTLQSDVICRVCGNSSPTLEKFFDISLDVDNVIKPSVALRRSRGPSPEISGGFGANDTSAATAGFLPHGSQSTPGGGSSRAGSVERPPTSGVPHTLLGKSGADGGNHSGRGDSASQQTDNSRTSRPDVMEASRSPSLNDGMNDIEELGEMETANSLAECLSRFTEPEMLGVSAKMFCAVCGTRQEAMKQMSIRALPPVLCLHFKRFEQSFLKVRRSEMVKVDTAVEFPVDGLDMQGFRTSSVLRRRPPGRAALGGNEKGPSSPGDGAAAGATGPGGAAAGSSFATYFVGAGTSSPPPPRPIPSPEEATDTGDGGAIYDLFAVVNHTGKIDRGHYTTLVRRRGAWFRCDDEKVSCERGIGHVIRSGEAYLVFYVQRQPNFTY